MWLVTLLMSCAFVFLASLGYDPDHTFLSAIVFALWAVLWKLHDTDKQLGRVLADLAMRVERLRKGVATIYNRQYGDSAMSAIDAARKEDP